MIRWFFAINFLLIFSVANANVLTETVKSWPCGDPNHPGKNLGLVISDTGTSTSFSYCDFDTLRGYTSERTDRSLSADDRRQNQILRKACADEDSPSWIKSCYAKFSNLCVTKKVSPGGWGQDVVKDSVDPKCFTSGTNGASSPPLNPGISR